MVLQDDELQEGACSVTLRYSSYVGSTFLKKAKEKL